MDANIVRAISIAVTTQSARLVACGIAAGLVYRGPLTLAFTAYAYISRLMLLYPQFQTRLHEALSAIKAKVHKSVSILSK